jgi:hypothetical protein
LLSVHSECWRLKFLHSPVSNASKYFTSYLSYPEKKITPPHLCSPKNKTKGQENKRCTSHSGTHSAFFLFSATFSRYNPTLSPRFPCHHDIVTMAITPLRPRTGIPTAMTISQNNCIPLLCCTSLFRLLTRQRPLLRVKFPTLPSPKFPQKIPFLNITPR